MALVWNNSKSFQKHIETMKTFRQSHVDFLENGRLLRDMPTPYVIDLSHGERLIVYLATSSGKLIFVPIWKIAVPENSQN